MRTSAVVWRAATLGAAGALALAAAPTVALADTPTPAPTPKAAKLVVNAPSPVWTPRNRWTAVRVQVANRGDAPAVRPRITVGAPRGVAVRIPGAGLRPTRQVATIAPGRGINVVVRLRPGPLARATGAVGVRVVSGRARAVRGVSVSLNRLPRPARPTSPLAGTYHWGFKTRVDYAWDNYGVHFQDDTWAYWGFPAQGVPTRCTQVTEERDEDGDPLGRGCRRYTYNPSTGALKVGDLTGSFRGGKLEVDGITMRRLVVPPAGATLNVSLTHRGFRGLCGLITGCTTWHRTIMLSSTGKFVRTRSSMSSIGGAGAPYVWAGNFPPDSTGDYTILPRGLIRLAFVDGTVEVHPIGIETNSAGRADAAGEGLLIGDTNFYPERD